jgi:nicotinate-nucleotide adenylyltransferase
MDGHLCPSPESLMDRKKRIAIYGGTFDPVHLGHLEVAKKVSELFEIDELLFVPAQVAPHKLDREVTPALHRYAMLVLATQQHPQLCVSSFELDAPDRRYTVDTLVHFKERFGASAELFFIMGADSWAEISTWRDWEVLLKTVDQVVVTRPGYDISLERMSSSLTKRIVDLRGSDTVSKIANPTDEPSILITDAAMVDISATDIRRAVRLGQLDRLNELVPRPVADYIRKYKLYRDKNEA